jgi:hypothetical protein
MAISPQKIKTKNSKIKKQPFKAAYPKTGKYLSSFEGLYLPIYCRFFKRLSPYSLGQVLNVRRFVEGLPLYVKQ